jgi:hypothetical protein
MNKADDVLPSRGIDCQYFAEPLLIFGDNGIVLATCAIRSKIWHFRSIIFLSNYPSLWQIMLVD